jgi:hypothetical protein
VVINRAAAASTIALKLNETSLAGSSHAHTLVGDAIAHWDNGEMHLEIPGTSVWIALIE